GGPAGDFGDDAAFGHAEGVRAVAGEREDVVEAVVAVSGGDDLAVRLQRERGGVVVARRAERRRHLAGAVEARVERAVGVVTGECEDGVQSVPAAAGDDALSRALSPTPLSPL